MITYLTGEKEVFDALFHLRNNLFNQKINNKSVLRNLSKKYSDSAIVLGAVINGVVKGLSAFYCNDVNNHRAFLSIIVVDKSIQGNGIGRCLLEETKIICRRKEMRFLLLNVNKNNLSAIKFYQNNGFYVDQKKNDDIVLSYTL